MLKHKKKQSSPQIYLLIITLFILNLLHSTLYYLSVINKLFQSLTLLLFNDLVVIGQARNY